MEDQLISLETAKLAKDKGFNEFCWDAFSATGDKIDGEMWGSGNINSDWTKGECTRPTQSLLQRWLREVHNIQVWVEPFVSDKDSLKSVFVGIWDDYSSEEDEIKEEDYKETYEEALECVLVEALNFIK